MTQKRTYLITFRTVGYGTAIVEASSPEEAEEAFCDVELEQDSFGLDAVESITEVIG